MIRLLLLSLFYLVIQPTIAQNCHQLKGQWINELGSVLIVDEVLEDGKIIGKYASSTGVSGKIFPLVGWINQSEGHPEDINISFMVKWKGYGSLTSWTGYCTINESGPYIKTIWNLVRPGKEYDWERIITNSSTFKPSSQ